MIEIIVKELLETRQDAPVFFEFPKNAPDYFLVLKKEGNPRENLISSALLIVDSYGPNLLAACMLNEAVKKSLDALAEHPDIVSSKRSGDYPAFDTKNSRYRYQAVQTITYYEE